VRWTDVAQTEQKIQSQTVLPVQRQLFLSCREILSVERPLFRRCGTAAAAEMDRVAPTLSPSSVSAAAVICRQTLYNAITRQHTSVDREIAADHESPHSRVLLSQCVGFVAEIRLILPTIDEHNTGITGSIGVHIVHGILPASSTTQTLQICHVEATHYDLVNFRNT